MAKMSIDIQVDPAKLDTARKSLADIRGGLDRALVGAINDTKRRLVTYISTGIRAKVNIKKQDIDPYLKGGSKAAKYQKSARARVVLSESAGLPLKYFGAKDIKRRVPKRPRSTKGMSALAQQRMTGGVRYKIGKGGSPGFVREAFAPKKLNGHIFKRLEKSRLPIIKLHGPSPWGVFVVAGMRGPTKIKAEELLHHELDRRVKLEIMKDLGIV
jgi:hypothetical protein